MHDEQKQTTFNKTLQRSGWPEMSIWEELDRDDLLIWRMARNTLIIGAVAISTVVLLVKFGVV